MTELFKDGSICCACTRGSQQGCVKELFTGGNCCADELTASIDELAALICAVRQMRSLQVDFFRTRDKSLVGSAKAAEKNVDELLERCTTIFTVLEQYR